MSFADLAGGAACGPSNPLQNLGKRFGQDRSTQFDRFGGQGGSSSQGSSGFRASSRPGANQAEGFHQHSTAPLDLAPLHGALPLAHEGRMFSHDASSRQTPDFEASFQQPKLGVSTPGQSPWAGDFMRGQPGSSSSFAQGFQGNPAMVEDQQMQRSHSPATMSSPAYRNHFQSNYHHQPRFGMQGISHMSDLVAQQQGMQQGASQLQSQSGAHAQDKTWNDAFTAFDEPRQAELAAEVVKEAQKEHPEMTAQEADELAATAGRLVSTVEHDQNDKFKQSNFLNLMRRLRDREAGIQGDDIVDTTTSFNGPRLDKGKGRALETSTQDRAQQPYLGAPKSEKEAYMRMRQEAGQGGLQMPLGSQREMAQAESGGREWLNDLWAEEDARSAAIEDRARQQQQPAAQSFVGDAGDVQSRMREDDLEAREFAKYTGLKTGVLGAQSRLQNDWEEDMDEASKEDFVGRKWEGTAGRGVHGPQVAEWDKLQSDWDAFEAGPLGLRSSSHERSERANPFIAASVPGYQFQEDNPYLQQSTRQHSLHSSSAPDVTADWPADLRSILESEAAVQQDPTDSPAWFNLGVKQQENERETSAIAALHRAVSINPLMKEAWLALAVSYTNENNRLATYASIERYIEANNIHATSGPQMDNSSQTGSTTAYGARHAKLVSSLLTMARQGSKSGEVDADVQVALGILFNSSDEFSKAVDCFSAAISVRPQDWLLYNRLGAVLSNSGRSSDALNYYRYALDLKPDFARCHFNLAISCLNLQMHAEAAKHCFVALSLQSADEAAARQQPSLDQSNNRNTATGSDNYSLWETLRVSLELQGKSDLADRTRKRDVSLFDISDFEGAEGVDPIADQEQHEADWFAMEPTN
ncbi:unnamed protein product [Sympodiomycopsis kandeliae]